MTFEQLRDFTTNELKKRGYTNVTTEPNNAQYSGIVRFGHKNTVIGSVPIPLQLIRESGDAIEAERVMRLAIDEAVAAARNEPILRLS